MSADPVILDLLVSVCNEALQLYEQCVLVFDNSQEGQKGCICIGKHFIFFVKREMNGMIAGFEKLSYLDIDKAISDTSSARFFLLELSKKPNSQWQGGTRILVQSEHRETLLQRIGLCWQAEVMFRNFEVKKFPQAKTNISDQMPSAKKLLKNNFEQIKVLPFSGYEDNFQHRGYSFWLREGFKSLSGLKDGTFVHENGWEVQYNSHAVVVPGDVRCMIQVDDEHLIMDLEGNTEGKEELRAVAMSYQQSLTDNLSQFYVVVAGQYLKRLNRLDDVAAWDGWEFFVRSKEYAFACVIFRRKYIPPMCSNSQDITVVLRCPAQNMTNDLCEVILDECRFVADSLASINDTQQVYINSIQTRLDTLHLNEDGYQWAEGQLNMVPSVRPAGVRFVFSIVKLLVQEGTLRDEDIVQAEQFQNVSSLPHPVEVAKQLMSEAEPLLRSKNVPGTRKERRNAWSCRISRYFTYCLDGGIMGERFTFAMLVQSFGRASFETEQILQDVLEFLLHVRPRDDWSKGFTDPGRVGLHQLLMEPDRFAQYSFNENIMYQLLAESYIATEWKKRSANGDGDTYESLLANLVVKDHVGVGLRTMILRQILDSLGGVKSREAEAAFEKTAPVLVPALVQVLKGSNQLLMSYATAALVNLTSGRENMKTLLVGMQVLTRCVHQLKIKHDELTLYTLYLLVNLTKTPHHRHIAVKEGVVPVLVDVLTSSYQNLRKQKILAEVASVIGQLCNDAETRNLISGSFPVLPCLLWVNDGAQPNTKLKTKLLFALRQLCTVAVNKIKVGTHAIPLLLDELRLVNFNYDECASNLILLLLSLATINSNALLMAENIESALEASGIQQTDAMGTVVKTKNNKLANLLWPKIIELKTRIKDAMSAMSDI